MTSSNKRVVHGDVVWYGKPWIVPAAIIRTVTVVVVAILFLWLEIYSGVAFAGLVGLPVWAWTFLTSGVIWLLSLLELLIFRASNTYVLRIGWLGG